MIYHGNFQFEEPESQDVSSEMFCGEDGCCLVCGEKMYHGGGDVHDADGDLLYTEDVEFEKICECNWQDLRETGLADVDGWMSLDEHGEALLEWLLDVRDFEWICADDIIRLSEHMGLTFKQILDFDKAAVVEAHVRAWSKYMLAKWGVQ
ncbi:MAG: hypothetical protein NC548_38115 [Lachnospiraceae bacterium]|nr:hypothetical protein [Lachnospiraceae bacterium]